MDRLSKRKFGIVCHGKVVRIPLEGESKIEDISCRTSLLMIVTKDIVDEHQQRRLNSRIDLVHGATSVAKSPYRLAPLNAKELSKKTSRVARQGVVGDALSRKEKVKSRRVRGRILAAQSGGFKQENVLAERLHGLDLQMEKKGDEDNSKEWNSGGDQLILRWMIYLVVLADTAESVKDMIGFDYHLSIWCAPFEALYGRKCRSLVLWAEIGESSLTGLKRKPLEFEVGDRVLLKVTPWKGVVRFEKKGKLAPRYVGPFEIIKGIGPMAY
ncbi:hypothetical protein Tco_1018122 [Tanacetum coccineum]|uniref:Tf2-1-like SH3-like domain-containing protein n=1 Tax=Tanacetum coccineum TaxID=301880 RepID=A0ABQ5FVE9_9ASTR